MSLIHVLISGATGKMGREVVKAIHREKDMKLVGAVDLQHEGHDIGSLCGLSNLGVTVSKDLLNDLRHSKADVVVDFTHPAVVMENARTVLGEAVPLVIGTTGLTEGDLKEIERLANQKSVGVVVAPNFAIGAVLMMQLSKQAVKHLPKVEIIELHHEAKVDAPSGTAKKTAAMLEEVRGGPEKVPIHSVRLPGLVAHQEVIFGGWGQTLSIRHDTTSRDAFMPGVLLAIRKVRSLQGLVYGLEHLL